MKDYNHDLIELHDKVRACDLRIKDGVNLIKERTNIHADVHIGSRSAESQIIVIGRYRNADYVQTFDVSEQEFPELLNTLKRMEQYGEVRKVDAPPMMRAVFDRELDRW